MKISLDPHCGPPYASPVNYYDNQGRGGRDADFAKCWHEVEVDTVADLAELLAKLAKKHGGATIGLQHPEGGNVCTRGVLGYGVVLGEDGKPAIVLS